MKRIETHRPRVPWSWVALMVFPWLPQVYADWCGGVPLAFTIRKFTEDPVLIALLSSVHLAFNFMVGAFTSYLSDRVWTRWGRRRPFLIPAWVGLAAAMFALPLAPSLWALGAIIIFWQFCFDFAKPYEPLYNEVIPSPQRGRASVLRNVMQAVTNLYFNGVLIAQFDRQYGLVVFGRMLRLNGEMILYWAGAVGILIAAALLTFGVRETVPLHGITRERFRFATFFRDVFGHREWWMVYLLYLCPTLAGGGIPSFAALFQTEQLHFTKEQIGWTGMVAMLINIVLFVPVAGFLADRTSRMRIFQIGLIAPVTLNLLFFLYVRYLTDYTLSNGMLLFFTTVSGTGGFISFAWVVHGPLLYDYIPSNRFGTVSAGFSFVQGLTSFILLNAVGFWVKGFTALFGSRGSGSYDYSSAYVLQFFSGVVALAVAQYFYREVKRGRVTPYAQLELEEERRREEQAGGTFVRGVSEGKSSE